MSKLREIILQKIAQKKEKEEQMNSQLQNSKLSSFEKKLEKKGWKVLVCPTIRSVGMELKYKNIIPQVYVTSSTIHNNYIFNGKDLVDVKAEEDIKTLKKWARRLEEVPNDMKGGIIAFSTDVNAVQLSENKVINWVKQKLTTLKNRFTRNKMLTNIIKNRFQDDSVGFTIGNFVHGNYKDQEGNVFNEKSLSIELIYIPHDMLYDIAEDIYREFKKEFVMVKDYVTNNISFLYQ